VSERRGETKYKKEEPQSTETGGGEERRARVEKCARAPIDRNGRGEMAHG
jgi:hypothetical protein